MGRLELEDFEDAGDVEEVLFHLHQLMERNRLTCILVDKEHDESQFILYHPSLSENEYYAWFDSPGAVLTALRRRRILFRKFDLTQP